MPTRTVAVRDYDFTVLSAMITDNGLTQFIISVPKATSHQGFLGPLRRMVGAGGMATKFGLDLWKALSESAAEASIHHDAPYVFTVFVSLSTGGEPPVGNRHQVMGLPEQTCEAIQEAIERNDRIGQRFAEYLRRIL